MNGSFVVDTNVIVDILRGKQALSKIIESDTYLIMPIIVLGELYFGANKSNQFQKKFDELQQLKSFFSVQIATEETAEIYGRIKNQLKLKGKPIPENDIWIAAISLENQMPLLTNDKHFKYIDNLIVVEYY